MDTSTRKSTAYATIQIALLCAFAAAVFFGPTHFLFAARGIPRAMGSVLCVAGLVLMSLGFYSLGRAVQISPAPRPGAVLVTRGVYRRFRHPLYTAIVLFLVGTFLRRPTPMIGATAIIVVSFLTVKARFEEKLLAARYSNYAEYKKRTWGVLLLSFD
jgi:protein-S-isoprenylcysteine O-methyltransferase Ste14